MILATVEAISNGLVCHLFDSDPLETAFTSLGEVEDVFRKGLLGFIEPSGT